MYVELVERSLTSRNKIIELGQFPTSPADYCRYISLFPYDKGIISHVKAQNTVSGYKGLHYCPAIVVDIDNEDLEQSRLSAVDLVKRINEWYTCPLDEIRIYFSGNKGFHISLLDKLFGGIPPHQDIAAIVKKFVSELSNGILNVDLKIYEPMRIFRCNNSLNDKSGLYKIPISFGELLGSVDSIKELAKTPRLDIKATKPVVDFRKNERLSTLLRSIKLDEKTKNIITKGFFSPPAVGERNSKLFKQACTLFKYSEINSSSILELISVINNQSETPLQDYEVAMIVKSAQQSASREEAKQDELTLSTIGGWADVWYSSKIAEKNKITLGFPSFDKEMKGKLRGKLLCIVGPGGTKKSLLAQNILYENAVGKGMRGIYSSMEMGAPVLIDRFIDMAVANHNENYSYILEKREMLETGYAKKDFVDNFAKYYSDNVLITQNNSLTCKEYETLIEKAKQEYGVIDILIVDGLSMMGGNGTETELVNKHTKELKDIAIKNNILVIVIVHVTKMADKYEKDYTKYLRGSGKIYDNLDIMINMTLVKGDKDDEPRKDIGLARLINKRGSGNYVDIEYSFNEIRLLMDETAVPTISLKYL